MSLLDDKLDKQNNGFFEPSDTDGEDESTDVWITSSASSQGRSSISSIPWAEDAIKQNQEEWESIEQMFYGEKPLPTNKKIRDEFQQWMTKFPHLRVIGQSVRLDFSLKQEKCPEEEVIAIDPPLKLNAKHSPVKHDQRLVRAKSNMIERQNNQKATDRIIAENEQLQHQIENCLRITSGPLLCRRVQHNENFKRFYKIQEPYLVPVIREERPPRATSVRHDNVHRTRNTTNKYTEMTHHNLLQPINVPLTLSANLMKMPPILSITHFESPPPPPPLPPHLSAINGDVINSSRRRRDNQTPPTVRGRLTLPPIHLVTTSGNFHSELIGRSISAINHFPDRYDIA